MRLAGQKGGCQMRNPVRTVVSVLAIAVASQAYGSGGIDPFYGDSGIATVTFGNQSPFHRAVLASPNTVVGTFKAGFDDDATRVYRADLNGVIDQSFGIGGFASLPFPGSVFEGLA